jgi:type I restriction enzyme M protein
MPDFNDSTKLGDGKEKVERLTNLIAIFENPALAFSRNRADGDDLLGDAYEYLMRHFATESGKSKGQFYMPAEVGRVIAQVLAIRHANATSNTSTTWWLIRRSATSAGARACIPDEGGKPSPDGQVTGKDWGRFTGIGIPPAKQGGYAYLLHILRSMKSSGKGASRESG